MCVVIDCVLEVAILTPREIEVDWAADLICVHECKLGIRRLFLRTIKLVLLILFLD